MPGRGCAGRARSNAQGASLSPSAGAAACLCGNSGLAAEGEEKPSGGGGRVTGDELLLLFPGDPPYRRLGAPAPGQSPPPPNWHLAPARPAPGPAQLPRTSVEVTQHPPWAPAPAASRPTRDCCLLAFEGTSVRGD